MLEVRPIEQPRKVGKIWNLVDSALCLPTVSGGGAPAVQNIVWPPHATLIIPCLFVLITAFRGLGGTPELLTRPG